MSRGSSGSWPRGTVRPTPIGVEGPSAWNGHGLDAALANFGPDVVRLVLAPKRLDEGGKTLERLAAATASSSGGGSPENNRV